MTLRDRCEPATNSHPASSIAALFLVTVLIGCGTSTTDVGSAMSAERVQRHVVELADDAYAGRGAGYAGERKAADYIARQFIAAGLQPPAGDPSDPIAFLQPFEFHVMDGPVPWQVLQSQNVVGVLPSGNGSDEFIVIGGHYDGQGQEGQASLGRENAPDDASADTIWNSAVDNATSIASLIEIARDLSNEPGGLARNIVFVAFGAEESALDGSFHYVANPVGGPGATIAMVNMEKIVGDADAMFLYVSFGSAALFPQVTEQVTRSTGVSLDPFYPGVIANTDHYPFILDHIPAVTIGTGSQTNVHQPGDHADGLDYALLAERSAFIRDYLVALANTDGDLTFASDLSRRLGATGGPATEAEMTSRGLSGPGFKVGAVGQRGFAFQAGVRPGDLVYRVNGNPIEPKAFYQGLEDLIDEDEICNRPVLSVSRDTQTIDLQLPDACPGDGDAAIR